MPLLDKLRNIFSSENKRKSKQTSYKKQDVDPNDLWDILEELGDGAFGKVYKAKSKVEGLEAALKEVEIKDSSELEEFSVEIDILRLCKHKNVVFLFEAYFFASKLWMYIEFCGGGALDSIMVDLEKGLTEPQIQYVCRQMCEGLDFLHQNFIIHRDLKAGNVLLTTDGQVKLADFGVSAKNTSFRQMRDTFIGTPYWMAPEVILCETIKDCPYTFKADIWSFGITLIELAQIQPPNHSLHPLRVLIKIQKSPPPVLEVKTKWSSGFHDFIATCLVKDPDGRPMASELLEHPFISSVSSNAPIIELLSEVKAEVILEEKELDDAMDDVLDSIILIDDDKSGDISDDTDGDAELQRSSLIINSDVDEPDFEDARESLPNFPDNEQQLLIAASRTLPEDTSASEDFSSAEHLASTDAKSGTPCMDVAPVVVILKAVELEADKLGTSGHVSGTNVEETRAPMVHLPCEAAMVVSETQGQETDVKMVKEQAADIQAESELPSCAPKEHLEERDDQFVQVEDLSIGQVKESATLKERFNELKELDAHGEENSVEHVKGISSEVLGHVTCAAEAVASTTDVSHPNMGFPEVTQHMQKIKKRPKKQVSFEVRASDRSRPLNDLDIAEAETHLPTVEHHDKDPLVKEVTVKPGLDYENSLNDHDPDCENKSKVLAECESAETKMDNDEDVSSENQLRKLKSCMKDSSSEDEIEKKQTDEDLTIDHSNIDAVDQRNPSDLIVNSKSDAKEVDAVNIKISGDRSRSGADREYSSGDTVTPADSGEVSSKEVQENECSRDDQENKYIDLIKDRKEPGRSDVNQADDSSGDHVKFNSQNEPSQRIDNPKAHDKDRDVGHDKDHDKASDVTQSCKELFTGEVKASTVEKSGECKMSNVAIDVEKIDNWSKETLQANNGAEESKGAIMRYKQNKPRVEKTVPCVDKADVSDSTEVAALGGSDAKGSAKPAAAADKKTALEQEEQKKQFRTLTKTRTFVVNGVVVTSQTSRVVLCGTENKKHQEHELWKADLRELKRLQKEENRQLQAIDVKAQKTLDELAKRQEAEMLLLLRNCDVELEQMNRQRQKVLNKLISHQNSEYKSLQKKVKADQERDHKHLRESLKQDMKLWKQGKETQTKKKEEKEIELATKERKFLEELHEKSQLALKRLSDQHRDKVVLIDKQYLQQKHQFLNVRFSRVSELEERHMKEKYEISLLQLKDKFILKRQLMMQHNNKEVEQMKRINIERLQELAQHQALELRRLPKTLKSDAKTRHLMYKESLRISCAGATAEQEKEKMKEFEASEKKRRKAEILRVENKQKRQMNERNIKNDVQLKELEEMHSEKQNLLCAHQDQKENELRRTFDLDIDNWMMKLQAQKQVLEEEFNGEIAEHENFYCQDIGTLLRVSSQRSLTGSLKFSGSCRRSLVM